MSGCVELGRMRMAIMRWFGKRQRWVRDQGGFGLVEALVAISILSIAAFAFVSTLSTGAIAVRDNDEQAAAQGMARNQLEYVKSYDYKPGTDTYPTVTPQEGYDIFVKVTKVPDADEDVQKIIVIVCRGADEILTVEDYKVNR